MTEEASPYAELAQRNSVLSAGLFEVQTELCRRSRRSKDLPEDGAGGRGRLQSSSPTKTHSTVATRADMQLLVSPASSKPSLRGRSRSSSCPARDFPQGRKGRARVARAGADALRADHASAPRAGDCVDPASNEHTLGSLTSQLGSCGSAAAFYGGWTAAPLSTPSLDVGWEAAVPGAFGQPCEDTLASTDVSGEQPARGPSPVPAVQCGTPDSRSPTPPRQDKQGNAADEQRVPSADELDAIVKQHPFLAGPKWLGNEARAFTSASKVDQAMKSKRCDSTDSSNAEMSTRLPSEASSPERSRRTSYAHSAKLSPALASGLSENNPLLGGLEWDSKPDCAQLDLLDRVLGGSARTLAEAGPPVLPANFLGGRQGTSMHTSLSAMKPHSSSPRKQRGRADGQLMAGLMSPSSIVQVRSSTTGRVEEATILLVDHIKGAYKIRTLDGHTRTVKAGDVLTPVPGMF